jgi:hypothetical protein
VYPSVKELQGTPAPKFRKERSRPQSLLSQSSETFQHCDTETEGFRGPERMLTLKSFAEQRRAYLLDLFKGS